MKVIIPVAGIGSRLRPQTLFLPKSLLPVGGSNILGHIIDSLDGLDISELILVTGYKGELIEEYMARRKVERAALSEVPVHFVHQAKPRGLGEAIHLCAPHLDDDEPVLIVLGDTLFKANLRAIVSSQVSQLCTRKVGDPERFGVVVTDEDGRIRRLVEKPVQFVSDQAIVGIYWIRETKALKEALDGIVARNIRTSGEYQLTDALAAMLEMGVEFRSAAIEDWLDCGKPETLLETNRKLLQIQTRNCSPQLVNCRLTPPYYIGDNVRLSNCSIGPNVSIFSNVEATDSEISDAVIGEATRIRNSKLTRTLIGRHCAVKDFSGSLNLGDYSEVGTL